MSVDNQISVSISENEVIRISRVNFEDPRNHVAVIDYQIEQLYAKRKITSEDFDTIREILKKV